MIGSALAYLLRNCSAVTWVSDYSCPIWTFCNWIVAIGQFRCARQSSALNWVLLIVVSRLSPLFATRIKYIRDVLSKGKKEEVHVYCTSSHFVIDTLRARPIWNYSPDYSLNCTPLSPITITNQFFEFEISFSLTAFVLIKVICRTIHCTCCLVLCYLAENILSAEFECRLVAVLAVFTLRPPNIFHCFFYSLLYCWNGVVGTFGSSAIVQQ